MKQTRKKRYSHFRKSRFLISSSVNRLLKEVKSKILHHSYLSASPYLTNENRKQIPGVYHWLFKKINKKVIIYHGDKRVNDFELKNNLLFLLRKSGLVFLTLNNFTNQKYTDDKTEIIELWGYKSKVFYNHILVEKIKSHEMLEVCTGLKDGVYLNPPQANIIYCGPDGKIFGWDLV